MPYSIKNILIAIGAIIVIGTIINVAITKPLNQTSNLDNAAPTKSQLSSYVYTNIPTDAKKCPTDECETLGRFPKGTRFVKTPENELRNWLSFVWLDEKGNNQIGWINENLLQFTAR